MIDLDKETGVISDKGDLQTFVLEEKKTEIYNSITDTEKISETEIKERVGGNSKGIISKALRLLFNEKRLNREGDGKRNSPFLYFKNQENLQTPISDISENEKPRSGTDNQKAKSEIIVSRFVGFSNGENLENTENNNQIEKQFEARVISEADFYICPNCPSQIPIAEDICLSCGKRAIEF